MNTPLPISDLQRIHNEASERGRVFREKGGTFRTAHAIREGNRISYYQVVYPPARYDENNILIPSEPIVTDRLLGMETVDMPETVIADVPSSDPQLHVWKEPDRRHPVPA